MAGKSNYCDICDDDSSCKNCQFNPCLSCINYKGKDAINRNICGSNCECWVKGELEIAELFDDNDNDDDKTYYKYEYNMTNNSFEVSEMDYYENETLNFVNSAVTGESGEYRFWMYSDSPNRKKIFLHGISEILTADHVAASRFAETAIRRFWRFQHFWKNLDEENKQTDHKE